MIRLDNVCIDCKHWGYNNGKPMNDVGESRCLRLKRKTHACQYCRDFSAVEKGEVKMQIINANEVKELINTKLDSFKKEMIDSIDAQLTISDINVAIERLEYELKDAEKHREDLTPNTELYYVNRGYVSGIMTALLIIKKGLK